MTLWFANSWWFSLSFREKNSVGVWWCRTSHEQLGARSVMWFALQAAAHQCHATFLRKGDSFGCVFKPKASCRGSREWPKTSNKTPWAENFLLYLSRAHSSCSPQAKVLPLLTLPCLQKEYLSTGTYPIRGPVALPTASLEFKGVWLPLSVMTLEVMCSNLSKKLLRKCWVWAGTAVWIFVSIWGRWHSQYTALKEESGAVLVPLQFWEKWCATVQCLE